MSGFKFDSAADFFAMGGYGLYVWPVYLGFAVFLLLNIVPPLLAQRKIIRQQRAKLLRNKNHQVQRAVAEE